jgi:hypothetical protein
MVPPKQEGPVFNPFVIGVMIFEHYAEDGITVAEENEDGIETDQRQTPHDARRPGFREPKVPKPHGFFLKTDNDT